MISQRKLAELLNLTQAAVSAALRENAGGTSKVAPETRQMVLEAARKYGYRPNRYASVLRSGKSNLIAILHGPMSVDWINKTQAVCDEVEARGYTPWTIDMRRFKGGHEGVFDLLMESKVEGVIAGPYSSQTDVSGLEKANIPVVAFVGKAARGLPFVGPNKLEGFYDVAAHLVAQGCRRITVCTGQLSVPRKDCGITVLDTASQAAIGLDHCLRAHGLTSELPSLLTCCEDEALLSSGNDFLIGKRLAQEALKLKPDALMFTNDSRAIGGMQACKEAGLSIPHDICITGFNAEPHGEYNWIPLTTVSQAVEAMAKDVVTVLMNLMSGRQPEGPSERLHRCTLIPRESSLRKPLVEPRSGD